MKKNRLDFFYGINLNDGKTSSFISSEFTFAKENIFKNLLKASTSTGLYIPNSFIMHARFFPDSLQLTFFNNQDKIFICHCFKDYQTKLCFEDALLPNDMQYPCFIYKAISNIAYAKYNFLHQLLPIFALAYFACEK